MYYCIWLWPYRFSQEEAEVQECLVRLIKSTDISGIQNCVNVVRLVSSIPCLDTFNYLCSVVIPTTTTALRRAAEKVAIEMLNSKSTSSPFVC